MGEGTKTVEKIYYRGSIEFVIKIEKTYSSIIPLSVEHRDVLCEYHNLANELMKLKLGYEITNQIVQLYLSKNMENTIIANEIMKYHLRENGYTINSTEAFVHE